MNGTSFLLQRCISSAKQQRGVLAAIAISTTTLTVVYENNNETNATSRRHPISYFNTTILNNNAKNHYTMAEGKRMKIVRNNNANNNNNDGNEDDDDPEEDQEGNDDDEEYDEEYDEEEEEELPPWWGPRLVRRLTRHFTRQTVRGDQHIPTDDGSQPQVSDTRHVDESELFHGQCLIRQMRVPAVPYPAWDYNWDGRMTDDTSLEGHKSGKATMANSYNKTRHIILVRHGQYDERPSDDINRKLTPLGRRQATKTGQRLAKLARGSNRFRDASTRGPCPIKVIRSSNMRRAKETAELIAQELKRNAYEVNVADPDEELNEALPAPMSPIRPELSWATEEIDRHSDRVERTFHKYIYRDAKRKKPKSLFPDEGKENENNHQDEGVLPQVVYDSDTDTDDEDDDDDDGEQDEFEIIVCHGNMIRYMFCRALQLPPEVWLRLSLFNCSLTYLMIRPNGMVTARMMGDVGHLEYEETTFSSNYGFKW